MENQKLDLVEICRIIFKRKWFILIFALCSAAIGLIFCLIAPKEYSSTTVFIVKTPENMDRNHVFRQGEYQVNDFFATENEIDNVLTISNNEVLLQFLVDSFHLQKHYQVKNKQAAYKRLKKRFKVTRNDTRSIEFRISDTDPQMAANLANTARWKAGNLFREFFQQTKKQFIDELQLNIQRVDKQIQSANDSIKHLRVQYQIYSALLPSRGKAIQAASSHANAEQANGMELLEKITSTKDQLVKSRSQYLSLVNEYQLGSSNNNIDMFYTVQYGWPSNSPSFPKIPLILVICFVAGIFFSVILSLLQAGVRRIKA